LAYIKKVAHVELYKIGPNGYGNRGKILDKSQFTILFQYIGKIVHDRDTKLTDARYTSMTDLLMAMDDHNNMVKEILFRSWYKNPGIVDPEHRHLGKIKASVGFYGKMNAQLGFNMETALAANKTFWNTYFPGKRDGEKCSDEFLNILEVRHYAGGKHVELNQKPNGYEFAFAMSHGLQSATIDSLDVKLKTLIPAEDLEFLTTPRTVANLVRCRNATPAPALVKNSDMTVREFFQQYFPEHLAKFGKYSTSFSTSSSTSFSTSSSTFAPATTSTSAAMK